MAVFKFLYLVVNRYIIAKAKRFLIRDKNTFRFIIRFVKGIAMFMVFKIKAAVISIFVNIPFCERKSTPDLVWVRLNNGLPEGSQICSPSLQISKHGYKKVDVIAAEGNITYKYSTNMPDKHGINRPTHHPVKIVQ